MKLEYFNLGARGQFIRHACLIGGLDFEDTRYEFADWPARKPSTPLGQLPVMTVDGTEFTQSVGLLRYVGGKAGIYPTPGTVDQLICEDVLESVDEIWSKTPKAEERREFLDTKVDAALKHVESLCKGPFVLGSEISVADLFVYGYVHFFGSGFMDNITPDDFAKYTKIQTVCESVKNHPKLKEYIAAGKVILENKT